MTQRSDLDSHQRTLRRIENRVLDDVLIGRARRAAGVALTAGMAGMASVWWRELIGHQSPHASTRIPAIAVLALVGASVVSFLALRLRRYRWCCAAAYSCGLAAVIGIGAFWWVRTGPTRLELSWLVLADLVAMTLAVGWLALVVSPIERTQPDMRGALQAK